MREEYQNYIKGNKLLTIPETLNVIRRTISLLMTNVKTHKLKRLKNIPKMLTMCSNAMWDILMVTEVKANQLTRNILMTKQ